MTKLNDTQLVILSGAAPRGDALVELTVHPQTAGYRKQILKLISLEYLVEVAIERGQPTWRTEADGQNIGLQITSAGLAAIGVDNSKGGQPEMMQSEKPGESSPCGKPAAPIVLAGSKLMSVVDLLRCEDGASLGEITALTNWLPHSARAALTGLRKKGHHIERFTGESGASSYRIAASPGDAGGSDLGGQQ